MDFSFYPMVDRNSNFRKRFGNIYRGRQETHDFEETASLVLLDGKEGIFSCNPQVGLVFLPESHYYRGNSKSPLVPLAGNLVPSAPEDELVEFPCMEISVFQTGTLSENERKILIKLNPIPVSESLSEDVFVSGRLSVDGIHRRKEAYSNFTRNSIVRLSKARDWDSVLSLFDSIRKFRLIP